jgi:hypothetical protein
MSAETPVPPTPPPIPTAALQLEMQAWRYVHGYLILALRFTTERGHARWRVHRIVESIGLMLVKSGALAQGELESMYIRERLTSGILYSIPAVERATDEQAKAEGNGGGGNCGHA